MNSDYDGSYFQVPELLEGLPNWLAGAIRENNLDPKSGVGCWEWLIFDSCLHDAQIIIDASGLAL